MLRADVEVPAGSVCSRSSLEDGGRHNNDPAQGPSLETCPKWEHRVLETAALLVLIMWVLIIFRFNVVVEIDSMVVILSLHTANKMQMLGI